MSLSCGNMWLPRVNVLGAEILEEDITIILYFLDDNIFARFGGRVFQQTIVISMGTNCAPLLADLFLQSFEADFLKKLSVSQERKLVQTFNLNFPYIIAVLSLNIAHFDDYLHII